jgi:hypothetical protein
VGALLDLESNLCPGVGGASREPLAALGQFYCEMRSVTHNQAWRIVALPGLEGAFQLKNGRSGHCLTLAGGASADGTPVVQDTCTTASAHDAQAWTAVPSLGCMQIKNGLTGKCLGVQGATRTMGAALVETSCTGTADDVWNFVP